MDFQPVGIIKTMPMQFFKDYGEKRFFDHFYHRPNRMDGAYFMFAMSGKTRYDVLYFYLLFDGKVQYRANIIQWEGEHTKILDHNGVEFHARAWVWVGAPVIKAPRIIEMKGFQGFRYTEELF